jgi:hypothetical protein
MTRTYDFELSLSRKEYFVLMDIRGLESNAHSLVMTAELQEGSRYLLRGSNEDFDSLLRDVEMEIDEELASKKNFPALLRIRKYITPTDEDWSF